MTDDRPHGSRQQSNATDATRRTVSSDYKVRGKKAAAGGTGVLGHNTATTGASYGVEGVTDAESSDAAGVRGYASGSTGGTYGVHAETETTYTSGAGLKAEARSGNSDAIHARARNGGNGIYTSTDGDGYSAIEARHVGSSGTTDDYAVLGQTFTEVNGVAGVKGTDGFSGSTDRSYGVKGNTLSTGTGAAGVRGEATQASGETYGVEGVTQSDSSKTAGVRGEAKDSSGATYGVSGETSSTSTDAAGVRAKALNPAVALKAEGRLTVSYNDSDSFVGNRANFPAYIENTYDGSGVVLGLNCGVTGDPTSSTNFIQFQSPDGSGGTSNNGNIEGNGSGGVTYETSGADYAEYMPRRNPDEDLSSGDIVGVVGDEITAEMADASRALVVTEAPAVTGNSPGSSPEERDGYEPVAFTGQIPAKVRGPVDEGDLIVPAGDDDGTGVAVTPAERRPGTPTVGQAWEADDTEGVSEVTVAVGIDDPAIVDMALESELDSKDERIEALSGEVEALREENRQLRERLAALEAQVGTGAAPADD